MYNRGLIPRNFAELAEVVPIVTTDVMDAQRIVSMRWFFWVSQENVKTTDTNLIKWRASKFVRIVYNKAKVMV